ncbi:MAG: hypothetical protein IKA82_04250 [Clostridia bacterium]|nr:hypothetical protein [Clostridia bacterium]
MLEPLAKFQNDIQIREYVSHCEADFEARLDDVVDRIMQIRDLKLIGLSGPTCSGKTTLSNKLVKNFSEIGRRVHIISIDNFYYPQEYLKERSERLGLETIDYESIDTIDFDELRECIDEIFSDDETVVPIYDFVEGKVTQFEKIEYDPNDIFIIEGIQAVYPRITALLKQYNYCSMIICPLSSLICNGIEHQPNDIRLMRRLVRDYMFRGASPEETLYLWKSVRANEDANIFPYIKDCDYVVDSTMPFELNILAPHLRLILSEIAHDSQYRRIADEILESIKGIEGIDSTKYIVGDSLYREFVG